MVNAKLEAEPLSAELSQAREELEAMKASPARLFKGFIAAFASHIKPWSSSTPDEKLNPNNGLLLCPNHDKLFDQVMITFDDGGNIVISDGLSKNDLCLLNISSDMRIDMNSQMQEFMKWHRNNIFIDNRKN